MTPRQPKENDFIERRLSGAADLLEQRSESNIKSEDSIMKEKRTMQLGMIGLGRMGANMVRRLIKGGHQCVVFDRSPDAVNDLVKENAVGAASLAELVEETQQAARDLADGSGCRCGQFDRRSVAAAGSRRHPH